MDEARANLLEGLVESSPDLILAIDRERRIVFANRAFRETFGLAAGHGILGHVARAMAGECFAAALDLEPQPGRAARAPRALRRHALYFWMR